MELEHPNSWFREIERLEKRILESDPNNQIAFYGSSTVRLWVNMKRDLAPLNVINLGFGGSSLYWSTHYFEKIFKKCSPETIVIYVGENDLAMGKDPREVQLNYKELILKARAKYPNVHLTGISLKPSPSRAYLETKINLSNRYIEEILEGMNNTSMIWLHREMLVKGSYHQEFYLSDGLHLSKAGYAIWAKAVRAHFGLPQLSGLV